MLERRRGVASLVKLVLFQTSISPDFPDGFVVSAWRLRIFLGKPSDSNDFLLKRPRNPMGESKNVPERNAVEVNAVGREPAAVSPCLNYSHARHNSQRQQP